MAKCDGCWKEKHIITTASFCSNKCYKDFENRIKKQGKKEMLNKLLSEPYVYWTSLKLTNWIEHEIRKLEK